MQNRLTLSAVLAIAASLVLLPAREIQAASSFGPNLQAGTSFLVEAQTKAGPGRCGVGKHWDSKKRTCVSKMK